MAQERELFLRRKRFQKGSSRPHKHGKTKVCVAHWWVEGQKKSKVLGRFADMPKSEAEAHLAVILNRINEDAEPAEKPFYTFSVYMDEIFLPQCRKVERVDPDDH